MVDLLPTWGQSETVFQLHQFELEHNFFCQRALSSFGVANHVEYYFLKFCFFKRFYKFYILSSCVTSGALALKPDDNLSILAQAG